MGSIGAGAADGLEVVLSRLFQEAQARQVAMEAAQRTTIDQQRVNHDQSQFDQTMAFNERELAARTAPKPTEPFKPQYFTVNGRVARSNPDNTVTEVYAAPEKPAPPERPVLVSPGQVLLDPETRQPIYTAPSRPPAANLRVYDPSFPTEVQSSVVRLRSQYPTFDAAVGALPAQLEQWQRKHPQLSPQKVLQALRQSYTGSGAASNPLDDFLGDVLGDSGAQTPGAPTGGGRAMGAGPRGATPPANPDAALQAAAAEVLKSSGYAVTPENLSRFLANPANRQRLQQSAGGR